MKYNQSENRMKENFNTNSISPRKVSLIYSWLKKYHLYTSLRESNLLYRFTILLSNHSAIVRQIPWHFFVEYDLIYIPWNDILNVFSMEFFSVRNPTIAILFVLSATGTFPVNKKMFPFEWVNIKHKTTQTNIHVYLYCL